MCMPAIHATKQYCESTMSSRSTCFRKGTRMRYLLRLFFITLEHHNLCFARVTGLSKPSKRLTSVHPTCERPSAASARTPRPPRRGILGSASENLPTHIYDSYPYIRFLMLVTYPNIRFLLLLASLLTPLGTDNCLSHTLYPEPRPYSTLITQPRAGRTARGRARGGGATSPHYAALGQLGQDEPASG